MICFEMCGNAIVRLIRINDK